MTSYSTPLLTGSTPVPQSICWELRHGSTIGASNAGGRDTEIVQGIVQVRVLRGGDICEGRDLMDWEGAGAGSLAGKQAS